MPVRPSVRAKPRTNPTPVESGPSNTAVCSIVRRNSPQRTISAVLLRPRPSFCSVLAQPVAMKHTTMLAARRVNVLRIKLFVVQKLPRDGQLCKEVFREDNHKSFLGNFCNEVQC